MKTKNQNQTTIIKLDNGFELIACPIRNLKKGEWFTIKPLENPAENQVFIRGEYYAPDKEYAAMRWNEYGNERFFKGNKIVYKGFIF